MTAALLLTVVAIVLVLSFDFTNGLHDASDMIATMVASRAATPVQAALLVGAFTFVGPVVGGTAVADTIGTFVDVSSFAAPAALAIILCGVTGAITWNLITWRFGLPSSSSQALVGGLAGAVILAAGPGYVHWGGTALLQGHLVGVTKIVAALFLSPVFGFLLAFVLQRAARRLLLGARPSVNAHLRRAQWVTTSLLAYSHGTNDAQKGMGIITLVLLLGGHLSEFNVPLWVIFASASAITVGTLTGGWRIVRTLGYGIYKVRPLHALDAQLASAGVILGASSFGGPVSTTQVVSTAIMGTGAAERARDVRWGTVRDIFGAWLITMPGAALVAGLVYAAVRMLGLGP